MKVDVIILNWNGKKDTLECLESLKKIHYSNFQILLVDNGSTDDSVAVIKKEHPEITIIETGENLGFAAGNNEGIRKSTADYIFLLNNDTIVDPHILNALVKTIQSDPKIGILGAKPYLYDEPTKLDHFGGMWNQKKGVFDLVGLRQIDNEGAWDSSQTIDYACGCALFVKKEVFEKIGFLEPQFFLIWEEADFCFRAREAGFSTMTCPEAKLWHKVSASFVGGKTHSTYFWWRNRFLWIERNRTLPQILSLYVRILIPDILNLYKLKFLKTLQLQCLRLIRPRDDHKKRKERILRYSAALQGIKDYTLRRFGNGPAWIYKK